MAKIDELRDEAQELGITLTGEESANDLKTLIKDKKAEGDEGDGGAEVAASPANYDFAVNSVKLNRAKSHIQKTQPELKGNALVAAVKARYVEIGGLLVNDKPQRSGKKGGRVVNMADDDGSGDTE